MRGGGGGEEGRRRWKESDIDAETERQGQKR